MAKVSGQHPPYDEMQETIRTYDRSAEYFSKYFRSINPARTEDIEIALSLVGKKNPRVFEIGCGDGRDAGEILRHTDNYTGIDASGELIRLARRNVPGAEFEVADIRTYVYLKGIDLVLALAVIIHLDREQLKELLSKLHVSLNKGGAVYISFKLGGNYERYVKNDEQGERVYYRYSLDDIREAADGKFTVKKIKGDFVTNNRTTWCEVALIKA